MILFSRERPSRKFINFSLLPSWAASAISHFETGTRKPSFDNLRRIADALEVTTDYLLGRVTDAQALAGADRLHRHLDRLTSDDREIAEDFLKLLADKAAAYRSPRKLPDWAATAKHLPFSPPWTSKR